MDQRVEQGADRRALDELAVNTIRTLAMDAVQQAHSGHPGTPMGLAPVVYALWQRRLRFDPDDPIWPGRDRFVLSAGHASMLLYAMLFLTGVRAVDAQYERLGEPSVTLEDIKRFRQLGSKAPGHPEYHLTSGVETTTGPLGQGAGNSVGMAIAERWLAARYNRPGLALFDYDVYALCSDGDMMEGVSGAAASLAGHLKLSNLCWFYDSNRVTIEGRTDLAFSEDVASRFLAYGWNVTRVGDANDLDRVSAAIDVFKRCEDRPTLIVIESHIGYGAPHKQDTRAAHGEPLGEEEIRLAKRGYGWPEDAKFRVPDGVIEHLRAGFGERGKALRLAWQARFADYRSRYPELAGEIERMQRRELPEGWDADLPVFPADAKGLATRASSGKVLNAIAPRYPWLVGGAADLAPSTRTRLTSDGAGDFEPGHYAGRNFHFGIREHAMGAVLNGLALSKLRAYGSSFLIFSDYMKPPVRLAALMELPVIFVFTHDSIGVGEDGPTHQPVEQLIALRAIPGLITLRPADANEVAEAWRVVIEQRHQPACLVLTRQPVPTLDRTRYAPASGLRRGAYVLADAGGAEPEVLLIGTGSEVSLCVDAYEALKAEGIRARVVSMPSWELFEQQDPAYRDEVLPPAVKARVSVEQASVIGWDRYVGMHGAKIGMHTFGSSAPLRDLETKFGFTPDKVVAAAKSQLARARQGGANPLRALQGYGQSVWLDYLRRNLVTGGGLAALVREDGLKGVTSNPSIFEKAIGGSTDYDDALGALQREKDLDAGALYERLAVEDIRSAADVLRPVFDATGGRDGFVSIEVSPYLAMDTGRTVAEARRLWREIARENLMVKVPATGAGLPAIRQLTAEGVNVNITLLFSRKVYDEVAEAYLAGLEERAAKGGDLRGMASVASFFVSRVDTAVDAALEEKLRQTDDPARRAALQGLLGRAAIANAKLAYERYKAIFRGERWEKLARAGARTQRLLWASTGTKNPRYSDVRYVEELIGPDTVNTMPPSTMDAFRRHGRPRASLEEGIAQARQALDALEGLGISLEAITDKLTADGVRLFSEATDKLLGAIERKRAAALAGRFDRESASLPAGLGERVEAALEDWRRGGKVRRLWRGDASLWTGTDEDQWLGWLDVAEDRLAHLDSLDALAREARSEGFTHAVLLGMGGSSLGAEVLGATLGSAPGFPRLHVLDSTDPAQVRAIEAQIDIARTLFIVSSKSGTTLEPNLFKQYFLERTARALGAEKAARRFIAITDPGSPLEQAAGREGYRRVYCGLPSIGGRYSVLSNFGLVPAAAAGIDVARLLDAAETMVHACDAAVPPADNPGVRLGLLLGSLAQAGRDKVTLVASPGIASFGAWLEQLIAESTGKNGRGLIPVDAEPLGAPGLYGADRVFAYLRLADGADPRQDEAIEALARAGQPVVRIAVGDTGRLGQEFFRWEMAIAVAGSVLGIDPFDQPDVEASKARARELTDAFEKTGKLPPEEPFFDAGGLQLFADPGNREALAAGGGSLAGYLKAHLGRLGAGDYAALLAYVERNGAHTARLQEIRRAIRDARRVATCLGFGPRFLHSTGQAYKGGPNTGVFIQVTCDDAADLPVPGRKYSFGVVKAAQARGDFDVLAERRRRALRVHLGADVAAGLASLEKAVKEALA